MSTRATSGRCSGDHLQRRVPGVGLAHHDDVVGGLEHLPGPGPQDLVIIDDDHPKRARRTPRPRIPRHRRTQAKFYSQDLLDPLI